MKITLIAGILFLQGCIAIETRQESLIRQCDVYCASKGKGICLSVSEKILTVYQNPLLMVKESYLAQPHFWCKLDQQRLEAQVKKQEEEELEEYIREYQSL